MSSSGTPAQAAFTSTSTSKAYPRSVSGSAVSTATGYIRKPLWMSPIRTPVWSLSQKLPKLRPNRDEPGTWGAVKSRWPTRIASGDDAASRRKTGISAGSC